MILQWNLNSERYFYFDEYSMKFLLISLQLMIDKKTKKVGCASFFLNEMVFKKFADLNDMDVEKAKVVLIEKTLAFSDFLILNPKYSHLSEKNLKESFNSLYETLIAYKGREQIRLCGNSKFSIEKVKKIVDDPLANDIKQA